MRQPLTSANKSLIALFPRNKANEDGGNTRYLTIFYVLEQHVLMNIPEELGDDDVVGVLRSAFRDGKEAAGDGRDYKIKEKRGSPADNASLSIC